MLDKKSEQFEKKENALAKREEELAKMREDVAKLNEQRVQELERISGLNLRTSKRIFVKNC